MPQHKQTMTLDSGRTVEVVPLAYEAWEDMEDRRLEALEKMAALGEGQKQAAELVALRLLRDLDRSMVEARVPSWDTLRKELSREEYLDLVKQLTARSAQEAEPENLSAGGGGSPIPAGGATAAPAAATQPSGEESPTAGGAATPNP